MVQLIRHRGRVARGAILALGLLLGADQADAAGRVRDREVFNASVAIVVSETAGLYGGTGLLVRTRGRFGLGSRTYLITDRHVVQPGYCSARTTDPLDISIQLQPSGAHTDSPARLVQLPLFKNGRRLWVALKDETIDLAAVPLPKGFLRGYKEEPVDKAFLATAKEMRTMCRTGSHVDLVGLNTQLPFDARRKRLGRANGTIAEARVLPILWTDTCTKPTKDILLNIAAVPGNSGGPVVFRGEHNGKDRPILGIITAGDEQKHIAGMISADTVRQILLAAQDTR